MIRYWYWTCYTCPECGLIWDSLDVSAPLSDDGYLSARTVEQTCQGCREHRPGRTRGRLTS